MADLDLRNRRIVFAGTDVILICKPLTRAGYQQCMEVLTSVDSKIGQRIEIVAKILEEHVVRVEGLTIQPEVGDPHPATIKELLDVGPLAGRFAGVIRALMEENSLPEVDAGKSEKPPAAG